MDLDVIASASKSYDWEGRKLIGYTIDEDQGGGDINYIYNDQGIRIGKDVWNHDYQYVVDGDLVLVEIVDDSNYYYYTYDVDKKPISMNYQGDEYFYIYDLQGNVIGLMDIVGERVVEYKYDAWGNIIYQTSSALAKANPYRYRGYRYDEETGYYYLQSRYYDPEIGRFLNMDDVSFLTTDNSMGINLFAYCANNPVMYLDITGKYTAFNYNIMRNSSLTNYIQKTNTSLKLFNESIGSIIFGNVSYTITVSNENPKLFYSYSNYGNNSAKYGAGFNINGWVGLEMFAATPGEIGLGVQITPWIHSSAQIGLNGIGISIGIDNNKTAYDVSLNVGWGTVGLIALAVTPVPGARAAAATAAIMLFIAGWINEGDGGYYF